MVSVLSYIPFLLSYHPTFHPPPPISSRPRPITNHSLSTMSRSKAPTRSEDRKKPSPKRKSKESTTRRRERILKLHRAPASSGSRKKPSPKRKTKESKTRQREHIPKIHRVFPKESKTGRRERMLKLHRVFEEKFGHRADFPSCNSLCKTIGAGKFRNIKECETALKGKHLNIVDLVTAMTTGGTCKPFASVAKLSEYIIKTKKMYPREKAKSSSLLKQFLIVVKNNAKIKAKQCGKRRLRAGGQRSGGTGRSKPNPRKRAARVGVCR